MSRDEVLKETLILWSENMTEWDEDTIIKKAAAAFNVPQVKVLKVLNEIDF